MADETVARIESARIESARPGSARMEVHAWRTAIRLILHPHPETGAAMAASYSLRALAGKVSPAHPAVKLLEAHLAHLRGQRGPLLAAELAPLRAKEREIAR